MPARYGPHKTRVLRCPTCKDRFPECKGTPLFDARPSADQVVAVLAHVAEGIGTRKTARRVGVHKDTVTRYIRRAAVTPGTSTTNAWLFPRRRTRSSSMRSGRSSAGRRSPASVGTGIVGATSPSTPSPGWS